MKTRSSNKGRSRQTSKSLIQQQKQKTEICGEKLNQNQVNLMLRWDVGCPGTNGAKKREMSARAGNSSGCFLFFQFRDWHPIPVWLSTIQCFREFEQLFTILLDADMSKITRKTGCKKPCSYKEYNFVNTNLKDLSYYTFPEDQIVFCLWAVSQNTLIEEEVLVYSFESLIAELGGSLGLFLGFSFMTIWDGLKNALIWMMRQKKDDNI